MADNNLFKMSQDFAEYLLGAMDRAVSSVVGAIGDVAGAVKTAAYNLVDYARNAGNSGESFSNSATDFQPSENSVNTTNNDQANITNNVNNLAVQASESVQSVIAELQKGAHGWIKTMQEAAQENNISQANPQLPQLPKAAEKDFQSAK